MSTSRLFPISHCCTSLGTSCFNIRFLPASKSIASHRLQGHCSIFFLFANSLSENGAGSVMLMHRERIDCNPTIESVIRIFDSLRLLINSMPPARMRHRGGCFVQLADNCKSYLGLSPFKQGHVHRTVDAAERNYGFPDTQQSHGGTFGVPFLYASPDDAGASCPPPFRFPTDVRSSGDVETIDGSWRRRLIGCTDTVTTAS